MAWKICFNLGRDWNAILTIFSITLLCVMDRGGSRGPLQVFCYVLCQVALFYFCCVYVLNVTPLFSLWQKLEKKHADNMHMNLLNNKLNKRWVLSS